MMNSISCNGSNISDDSIQVLSYIMQQLHNFVRRKYAEKREGVSVRRALLALLLKSNVIPIKTNKITKFDK